MRAPLNLDKIINDFNKIKEQNLKMQHALVYVWRFSAIQAMVVLCAFY